MWRDKLKQLVPMLAIGTEEHDDQGMPLNNVVGFNSVDLMIVLQGNPV